MHVNKCEARSRTYTYRSKLQIIITLFLLLFFLSSAGTAVTATYWIALSSLFTFRIRFDTVAVRVASKAIPVTGRGGPQDCETSRFPHLLDYRLTDGGEVVSLTRRPHFTLQEDSWYVFLLEAESMPGP
jgi:hypothetical protein